MTKKLEKNKVTENTDRKKYPKLRNDIVVSKMVGHGHIHYVVKDPLKDKYFRFNEEEWLIIDLFRGEKTTEEIVDHYNQHNKNTLLDQGTLEEYWSHLDSIDLLQKDQKEMNLMLVEKMKEMRRSQLLSKSGSIMYKRFPIVDPDKFFNRIISKISFFWNLPFFIFSLGIMLLSVYIILTNLTEFNQGVYKIFSFSQSSFIEMALLWVVIYITIAIHELGHGLTCKYYGGEVHEIGFLLLFFQPCLYCNVNDAWLFDKKWKQIMVTIAGGYIEFFIGSIFGIIWAITSPNTLINTLSLQIMTIASVSTILFNFNPLMKLDGYYLLSDFLEVPNLKEESFKYLQHFVEKYIFKMPTETFYATKREKRIYLIYGLSSFFYMVGVLTGLVFMAKTILVDKFHAFGMIMTMFIAYKIFNGHVRSSFKFLLSFYIQKRSHFQTREFKIKFASGLIAMITLFLIPIHYKIRGTCNLNSSKVIIIRAQTDGQIEKFIVEDGQKIHKGDLIAKLSNTVVYYDREIASIELEKSNQKMRKVLAENPTKLSESTEDTLYRQMDFKRKQENLNGLDVYLNVNLGPQTIVSIPEQIELRGKFIKKGDEMARAIEISKLLTKIEVSEQTVRFLKIGQKVEFKLKADPVKTYNGHILNILPSGKADRKNPQRKIYEAILEINNNGMLRPGMAGLAKIYAEKINLFQYTFIQLSSALRLDLFY
jgi:putative peptide zinc metalloprotease protein